MAPKTHIFFTGATGTPLCFELTNSLTDTKHRPISGFVGGSVLQRLLSHPKRDALEITALVRNADKAKGLNTLGVNTVVASLFDFEKVTELAAASNLVINTVLRFLTSFGQSFALTSTNRRNQTA
jgi:nucleoside-diphosphate-sugar epimerase